MRNVPIKFCSTLTLSLLGLALPATAQNWFGAPLVVPDHAATVCAADYDGDGDVDIVSYYSGLRVRLNTGSGEFGAGNALALYPGSLLNSRDVLTGDVNGDQLPDIIVRVDGATDDGFAVHLNLGGATFAAPVFVGSSVQGGPLALGDNDADGSVEVAVLYTLPSGGTTRARWYDWNGVQFVGSAELDLSVLASGITTCDWTGDGLADIVISRSFANSGIVCPTVAGDPVIGIGVGSLISGPGTIRTIQSGDIDGDGDVDLLMVESGSNGTGYSSFLNDGQGAVTGVNGGPSPFLYSFKLDTDLIRVQDLDGDGDVDWLVQELVLGSNEPRMMWFEGAGDGTFTLNSQDSRFEGGPDATADFDGDGFLDIASGSLIVFGDGTVTSPTHDDFGLEIVNKRPLDWEGDGDLDMVPLRQTNDRFAISVNDGSGEFTSTGPLIPEEVFGQHYERGVLADFDGDGVRDLLIGWKQDVPGVGPIFVACWRSVGNGAGGFTSDGIAVPPLGTEVELKEDSVVDFDADGDLDLIVDGGVIWENDGAGHFSEIVNAYVGGDLLSAGDMDGDGDQDLLTRTWLFGSWDIVLNTNQGNGTFVATTLLNVQLVHTGLRFMDLDGDGDLDIVGPVGILASFSADMLMFENHGGGFTLSTVFDHPHTSPATLVQGDVDGDGNLDVVALTGITFGESELRVYRNRGNGLSYAEPVVYRINRSHAIADIDGDGDLDVIGLSVYRGLAHDSQNSGSTRQFGAAVAGTGGALPLLGGSGALAVGNTMELRVRHAVGGTVALLAVGSSEVALGNSPLASLTTYVGNIAQIYTLHLGGTPGAQAEGSADFPVVISASLAGVTQFLQLFPVDGNAPNGVLSQSNGLELTFGF